MTGLAFVLVWFSVNIWATWFVSRQVSERGTRVAYYLLIWLVPIVGAAAAVLFIGFGDNPKSTNSQGRMFDAVVDARKRPKGS